MPAKLFPVSVLTVLLACATPSFAESLAGSASSAGMSASSAGSASVQGSSDAISGSSDSSMGTDDVAAGEYRLAAVERVDEQGEWVNLNMQPINDGQTAPAFKLRLPAQTVGREDLSPGDVIQVQHRPYGLEFTNARTRTPFYLVLADDWQRDMQSRVLTN